MTLRRAISSLSLVLAVVACDSSIEIGERCERSSQCADSLACVLGRCRVECVENDDCAFDGECHVVDGVGVCRLPSDVCEIDDECTAPLVCAEGGVCRAICIENADCAAGSRCVPSDGRNLCVPRRGPDGGVSDAGSSDAAITPDAGRTCRGAVNGRFALGLEGWCLEASSGIDPRDHAMVSGPAGEARTVAIDLAGVAAGGWVRLYQDIDLDEGITTWAQLTEVETPSGAVVVALEALDASGALIARSAYAQGSGVTAPCDAAGRTSDRCTLGSRSLDLAIPHGVALGQAGADLSGIRTLRRTFEVIAGTEPTRARLDSFFGDAAPCALAWWRSHEIDVLRETMDHPWTALDPSLTWAGTTTAPIHTFPAAVCGAAIAFEGERWLERATPLPLSAGPLTIELWWHGEIGAVPRPDRTYAILAQSGGDLGLLIANGVLTAVAGRCADGSPALAVRDSTHPIGAGDVRFQEVELLVDVPAGRLCMHREGVEIGCDEVAPGCMPMPLTAGPVRIGAGAPTHERFRGAIDELRIRSGVHTPGTSAANGRCFLDRVCDPVAGERSAVRDSGSYACVAPAGACSTVSACPQHASSGAACTAGAAEACVLSEGCFQGVAACAGGMCRRAEQCEDRIRIVPGGCP